jgi:hypothetical protein
VAGSFTTNAAARLTLGAQPLGTRDGGAMTVTFTVPASGGAVTIYCLATGSCSISAATADSFSLSRLN